MRKLLILVAALLSAAAFALASPASPEPYPYTQPDGTVIILQNHGDEFDSWITCNGVEVEKGSDGFFRPVTNVQARKLARRNAARPMRDKAARLRAQARAEGISHGEKRFLVVLIGFPDREFTTADAAGQFHDMLNEAGYSYEGAPGSAKDYFTENSGGEFVPSFDVYGPVTVSESYAYYGQDIGSDHSGHATQALYEACNLLDSEIDFSLYDNDGDGYVDNTFFFFAGHSQSAGADADAIWSHQYSLYNYNLVLDGVRVFRYACAPEYRGASGTLRPGIGTFCHEFSHCLGLPDFYDTNGATNGRAYDLSSFSVMDYGNSNNEGRTPPYMTSIERQMLGWMGDFRELSASGDYTLGALSRGTVPYMTGADVDGEFFVYEMRDGTRWDSFLPEGLVIYHVDRSQNYIASGVTAADAWNGHYVNRYGDHPCLYLEFSSAYNSSRLDCMVYPGRENVTSFVPLAWSGNNLPCRLSGISIGGSEAHFRFEKFSDERQIIGLVTGTDGDPVEGVTVAIEASEAQSAMRRVRSNLAVAKSPAYSSTTAADGSFSLSIPESESGDTFMMSASKEGYVTKSAEVTVNHVTEQNFALRRLVEAPSADIRKYPDGGSANGVGWGKKPQSVMGAIHLSNAELQKWGGMQLRTVTFQYAEAEPYAGVAYVIVDQAGRRVLSRKAEGAAPYTNVTVDVSDAGIQVIPGKDMYIGYALEGVNAYYPLLKKSVQEDCDGFYLSDYSLTGSFWSKRENEALLISVTLLDPDAQKSITLSLMGYNSIADPGDYKAGDRFFFELVESALNRPESVAWYYDGTPVQESSVTLTGGSHRVRAVLSFADGSTETLVLELDVR